jgi:hypothetical protein
MRVTAAPCFLVRGGGSSGMAPAAMATEACAYAAWRGAVLLQSCVSAAGLGVAVSSCHVAGIPHLLRALCASSPSHNGGRVLCWRGGVHAVGAAFSNAKLFLVMYARTVVAAVATAPSCTATGTNQGVPLCPHWWQVTGGMSGARSQSRCSMPA